ncbi:hypothetical protein BGZ96_001012 [Linnemannia gamsii]|uniref:AB hydrolase-1 domain-containing protein n=1 Tax=Linnemannia gamsii TaxID=64522 RepID=A0ABQ7JN20_9FUNG|nr:hypothetical protein BGZ96_001012 [Linnemannia gamsii]
MQRSNSTGNKLPFRRRQSTTVPPPVPYANPAATQFLRLGVGIDHVDVDQSDDEDVIYQGIENGMDGHDGEQLDTSDEEEQDSDEEDEDVNHEEGNHADNDNNNDDDENKQDKLLLHQASQPQQSGIQVQEQQALNNSNDDNIRAHKPQLSIDATAVAAQASTSSAPSLSSTVPALSTHDPSSTTLALAVPTSPTSPTKSASPPRILTKIDTQLRHKGETSPSSTNPSQPISPRHLQGPASPRSPTSPSVALPKGLPVYHEKFTKAASTKIHGASPLSNVNNAVTANSSSSSNEAKPTSPSRRSTHAHQLTETILAPGTEATPTSTSAAATPAQYLPVKRFPEQVGFATIHNWKIHYKICYPTLDPAYRINGNGRNIVLFHGALSNLGTWRKVQQTLADRTGCRVLSYDRVGYGLSEKPAKWPKNANPYKNGGVLAICQALLDTLGMQNNVILVGNGTGGTVASAVALSKPMSVRGLILLAPAIQDEAPPLYLRACVSYPPPLSWIYRGLYGDHGPLQQYYYKPKAIMAEPSTVEMYMKSHKEEGFWRGLSNATKYRSSFKVEKHVERLTELSTLVMTGDVDDVVPTIETLRLFETLQSVRKMNVPQVLKIIKHSGHLPQEEKPSDVVKVISFFVKKVCLGSLSRERSLGRRMSGGVQRSPSKKSTTAAEAANNQAITDANTQANAQGGRPPVGPAPSGPTGPAQGRPHPGQVHPGPGLHSNMAPVIRTDLPMRGSPAIAVDPVLGHGSQAIKTH